MDLLSFVWYHVSSSVIGFEAGTTGLGELWGKRSNEEGPVPDARRIAELVVGDHVVAESRRITPNGSPMWNPRRIWMLHWSLDWDCWNSTRMDTVSCGAPKITILANAPTRLFRGP